MKRHILAIGLFLGAALGLATLAGSGLTGGPYVIDPIDINCGGTRSTGGVYELTASTGQSGGIGKSAGGPYESTGGFWAQVRLMGVTVTASRGWVYENDAGITANRHAVTFTATVTEDLSGSVSYAYNWEAVVHPVVGVEMVLVGGGGPADETATYAAPQAPAASREAYAVTCQVVGKSAEGWDTADASGEAAVIVRLLGDADGDHEVTPTDFSVWRVQNGQTGTDLAGDFNGDGQVTVTDFSIWRTHNGQAVPQ